MLYCKKCDGHLGHYCENGKRVFDVGYERLGLFCKTCAEIVENDLKNKRFVEEYKGNQIYLKDERYFPYWECQYFFNNLDDVKIRIDNPHIAIVDTNAFKFLLDEVK